VELCNSLLIAFHVFQIPIAKDFPEQLEVGKDPKCKKNGGYRSAVASSTMPTIYNTRKAERSPHPPYYLLAFRHQLYIIKNLALPLIVRAGAGVTAQADDEEEGEKHRDKFDDTDGYTSSSGYVEILLHKRNNKRTTRRPCLVGREW